MNTSIRYMTFNMMFEDRPPYKTSAFHSDSSALSVCVDLCGIDKDITRIEVSYNDELQFSYDKPMKLGAPDADS